MRTGYHFGMESAGLSQLLSAACWICISVWLSGLIRRAFQIASMGTAPTMIGLVSLNIPCMLVIVTLMEGSPASARAWATPRYRTLFPVVESLRRDRDELALAEGRCRTLTRYSASLHGSSMAMSRSQQSSRRSIIRHIHPLGRYDGLL